MGIMDYVIGSKQSKYSAIAIYSALFAICVAILFSDTGISFNSRLITVLFILIFSVVPIFMSLFELTCIVNGSNNKYSPCNVYAWIVAILIIFYCFVLIIIVTVSIFTYKRAIVKIESAEKSSKINENTANSIANNIIVGNDMNNAENFSSFDKQNNTNSYRYVDAPVSQPVEEVEVSNVENFNNNRNNDMNNYSFLNGEEQKNINKIEEFSNKNFNNRNNDMNNYRFLDSDVLSSSADTGEYAEF